MTSDSAFCVSLCAFLALSALKVQAASPQLPIKVNVQGNSGKFTVYPEAKGPQSGIQVEMSALREVNSNGEAVGMQGSNQLKHSIQTFASQTFTIDPLIMTELNGSNGSVPVAKVAFQSDVGNVGKIGIDTYVVAGAGTVGSQNETWAVRLGDLKWNIRIWDWTFCDGSGAGACRAGDIGQYIELDVSVKGLGSPSKSGNKTIDLGGQVNLELSNQVWVDNTSWSMMSDGYPSVNIQGSATTITFRFPKFSSNILYDPVLGTSSLVDGSSAPTTTTASSSSISVFSASHCFFLAVFLQGAWLVK